MGLQRSLCSRGLQRAPVGIARAAALAAFPISVRSIATFRSYSQPLPAWSSDANMHLSVSLCLSLLLVVATVAQLSVSCDRSLNYGGAQGAIYNTACPPQRPYCTGTGGSNGLCSECAVGKDPLCDCPPNYKCAAARFNPVRNADFCSPMPLTTIDDACMDNNDCPVRLESLQTSQLETAFFTSCVNADCRYCNGRSFSTVIYCQQGEVPGGGDPRAYGSKASTARTCAEAYNAWNSNTAVLSPPLPTDPFQYERNQYATLTPSVVPATPTRTPSLSEGASPSGTRNSPSSSVATVSLVSILMLLGCVLAAIVA